MEQLIIIGLLLIIVFILLDKKYSINMRENKNDRVSKNLPSILGKAKQMDRQSLPTDVNKRQKQTILIKENNFGSETKKEKVDDVDRRENLDDVSCGYDDWEEEEEDWKHLDSKAESGFATGVTFQELSTAGRLLQKDVLKPDAEQQAVDILQKINETELFDLLEKSLGDSSKKIAILLKERNSSDDKIIPLGQNGSSDGFEIGDFV